MKLLTLILWVLAMQWTQALGEYSQSDGTELKKAEKVPTISADTKEHEQESSAPAVSTPDDPEDPDPSVSAAFESSQQSDEASFLNAIARLLGELLSWIYDVVTHDFCSDSTAESQQARRLSAHGDEMDRETHASALAMSDNDALKRTSRWKVWRKHKPPCTEKTVVNRISCFMRRANMGSYLRREHAPIRSGICETLCESCVCDFDPKSSCSMQLEAWKQKTAPIVYQVYAVLHYSRLLCFCAAVKTLVCDFLRKQYIYKVVVCMPLLVLFVMMCRVILTIVQLRKYLENSRTPAAYTAECSYHHSEEEDTMGHRPLEGLRRPAAAATTVHKHHNNHADIYINSLNQTLAALKTFSSFVETTRAYYKTRIDGELRSLLEATFKLAGTKP
ncbi:uncharacterized protein LOC135395281 isoform X2 [Ornithodoros turicata]